MNNKINPKIKNHSGAFSLVGSFIGLFMFLALGVALVLAPTPVFSAPQKLREKSQKEIEITEKQNEVILEKANLYYNKGQYQKAVEEINIGIELHQASQTLPDNMQLMGEASYYAWINMLYRNTIEVPKSTYDKVVLYLTLHPEVMSTRIDSLVYELYENQKLALEQERVLLIEKNDRIGLNKILQKIYRLEQNKKDLDEVIAGAKSVTDVKRSIQIEVEYRKAQQIKYMMISLYVLIFIGIVILILCIHNNHKKTIEAQKQFETTMKVVAILQRDSNLESPYAPLKPEDSEDDGKFKSRGGKKLGLSDYESGKIAHKYFEVENAKKNFIELQNNCTALGEKIDAATGRKRNSRKVSELVFKLCKVAGVDDELSLIYYCAAMVYDAGFLSVPKSILQGEHLTIKERYEVRSHVQKAVEYFGFIPEEQRKIFLDAAEFHHENVDGKGYLAGLSGTKIPLIARFIRVAESYVSLISSRSYRKIMDVDSALQEMRKKPGVYDPKILALLEKVI